MGHENVYLYGGVSHTYVSHMNNNHSHHNDDDNDKKLLYVLPTLVVYGFSLYILCV